MRVRRILVVLLLVGLAGAASAVPLLPAEFWGTVSVGESPAPAGTIITARIDGRDCGEFTTTAARVYGGETLFDERLIVSGGEGDAGKTITFLVGGAAAGTAVYAPGTSTHLDLMTAGVKGDFDGDGEVDIGDVAHVAYMVVGKAAASPAADFNENGAVDIGDAAKIAYYYVGMVPAL